MPKPEYRLELEGASKTAALGLLCFIDQKGPVLDADTSETVWEAAREILANCKKPLKRQKGRK